MIAKLKGILDHKSPTYIVVDCQGVGYGIHIPLSTYSGLGEVGSPVSLFIHTYHKEDRLELFGFLEPGEKELFELLIGLSGIGPGLALSVLSSISVDDFEEAIAREDISILTQVSGIGPGRAEKIIFELRRKYPDYKIISGRLKVPSVSSDAIDALISLGFSKKNAHFAVKRVLEGDIDPTDVETIIKAALRIVKA